MQQKLLLEVFFILSLNNINNKHEILKNNQQYNQK